MYLKVLDMSPWLHNECTSKEKTYRLSGVVSFFILIITFSSVGDGGVEGM